MLMLTFAHVNSRPEFFTVSNSDQIFASVNKNTREVKTKRELAPEEAAAIEGFLRLRPRKSCNARSAASNG
jgi:hypothetical protein